MPNFEEFTKRSLACWMGGHIIQEVFDAAHPIPLSRPHEVAVCPLLGGTLMPALLCVSMSRTWNRKEKNTTNQTVGRVRAFRLLAILNMGRGFPR